MTDASIDRQAEAVSRLREFERVLDAEQVTSSLQAGLSLLVDRFYWRIHFDVEALVGADSMLMPLSETKAAEQSKEAIEVYQIVESAWAFREFGYATTPGDWYLPWLGDLRLGERMSVPEVAERLDRDQNRSPDARRRAFVDRLLRILPESGRSPLILPRLFPLAVHIATALAFGDRARAQQVRAQQIALLPMIEACNRCQGSVLANGRSCEWCSNPLWNYRWLNDEG
jgi:hypothetical protein